MAKKNAAKCKISLERVFTVLQRQGLVASSSIPLEKKAHLTNIVADSRHLSEGDCFIAFRGQASDGHRFINEAIAKKSALLIAEDREAIPNDCSCPFIIVTNGRAAWSHLVAETFNNPQKKLEILAVTGTNGKTSTVWMVGEILRQSGYPCLTIGTLGADFGDKLIPTNHTTPDPDVLFQLLDEALSRGYRFVAMEASSHAIVQEKLSPIRFKAAAFTSFSRDHLDFHVTLDAYLEAKLRLFTELCDASARKVFWSGLAPVLKPMSNENDLWFYGTNSSKLSDKFLQIREINENFTKTTISYQMGTKSGTFEIPYFGHHIIENFCAAYLLVNALDLNLSTNNFLLLRQIPGRLQRVSDSPTEPQVIVDYAHTPDALQKTLEVLRPLCSGKLIVIFGCGGDRDRGKRPIMGSIAEKNADLVCVTSDNPRTEDPQTILQDILSGFLRPEAAIVIADRRSAIDFVVKNASTSDTVLIAGKGHEDYQIVGTKKYPFDDRNIAAQALLSWNNLSNNGRGF